MTWTEADHSYMSRALQLARRGLYTTHPNPRVGCVIVKEGKIISEGWHEYTGGPHAEINALKVATHDVKGATCYVTLEPCSHTGRTPPCADTLIEAGIVRVIVAMPDPNPDVSGNGLEKLRQAGIEVMTGLLAPEAIQLNRGYILRREQGRPLVRCKLGMSLDGRTAMADGESKWITGPEARLDVQKLRARSSAVMTGIGTVLADDPGLDVRELQITRVPARVIIDPQLRLTDTAKMLTLPGRTLVFTFNLDNGRRKALGDAGAEVITMEDSTADLPGKALEYLATREECNEVLLESGAGLAGSMLSKGLIDEIILYQAPVLMGDNARGLFHLPEIRSLQDSIKLQLKDVRKVGNDLRLTLVPSGKS